MVVLLLLLLLRLFLLLLLALLDSSIYDNPIQVVTVDESVIAYQPSAQVKKQADQLGEPIPVEFLPMRPHPNGLETFLAVTPVDHPGKPRRGLPYILDIHPHLRVRDCSSQQIVRLFMQRWLGESKPHWVGDAAFGSTEVLAEIEEEWREIGTFSISNSISNQYLWEVLSSNIPHPNTWVCCYK